ncbi:MAG: chemotaxis protein CheR, partial [Myxococcaceae bacterium]|nr:chemotaxis protein CheR [Myxococcaceae bacterium]
PSAAGAAPAPAPSRPPVEGVKRTTTFDDFKALRPSEAKAPDDPVGDGVELFHRTLDGAAMGQSEAATEAGLRQSLYLAPDLVPARYLLGVLLEEKGLNADAASEFRRAHLALKNRKARMTSFFLNASRLELACEQALKRLGY